MANEENMLKKEEFINVIEKFLGNINSLEINVMFVDSNINRNKKYIGYRLQTSNQDILPTIESSMIYVTNEINKRSFEQYDLELSLDETVQIVDREKVINGEEIILEFNECTVDNTKNLSDKFNLDRLNFIMIQLYNPEDNKCMYLFEKYIHFTSKYKNSTKFTLNGNQAAPFKKDIITINPYIDAILLEDNYYILNRNNFNTIFNFKDVFYKIINENKNLIEKANLFVESNSFIEDCVQDGRYLPRLAKVILSSGFEEVKKNKSKLPKLKKLYNLKFTLNKNNEIEYNDKKEISDIINVLLDHFVISALTDKKMIAKAIEKYEI